MSAFICSRNHIEALALYWGLGNGYVFKTQQEIQETADIFFNENVRSVRHRYPDYDTDDLPGPVDLAVPMINQMPQLTVRDPVQILKLAQCLDYQSCETEDWRESKAYELLNTVKSHAISHLPGYNKASWDI